MIWKKSSGSRLSQMPGVDTHQAQDLGGLSRQNLEGVIHRFRKQSEFREVAIVSGLRIDFLPKILDRIVVGRVGRQLVDGETVFVPRKKFPGGFAGVVTSAILDQDHRSGDLRKEVAQERLIGLRLKSLFGRLR